MKNIQENKLFAIGMILFYGIQLVSRLPLLSRYAGSNLYEFLSGAGSSLIIVGLLKCIFGTNLRDLKKQTESRHSR